MPNPAQAVLDLVDKHRDATAFERAATLAWTQAQVQLHHLGIDPGEAGLFQRLAGHLLHAGPTLRPSSDTILRGAGGQPGLWPMGISGDLPIVLLRIADIENLDIARQLLQAHEYWRMKQLAVDLVILNERASSYVQDLQIALETLVRASQSSPPDGVERRQRPRLRAAGRPAFGRRARALLASVARVVLVGQRGSLADQLDRVPEPQEADRITRKRRRWPSRRNHAIAASRRRRLEFFNGLGGFADDGREYVTILGPGQSTPAPWINVIANPDFGFQVATEGGGYTWSVNSRENQLTPWSNDPVSDRPGEVFYLRDDDTGDLWCPTALPIRDDTTTYVARHGWGYSRFEHAAHGIAADLAAVRAARRSDQDLAPHAAQHIGSHPASLGDRLRGMGARSVAHGGRAVRDDRDRSRTPARCSRAIHGTPPSDRASPSPISRGRQTDWTGDRREFIGRNGTLESPAALAGHGAALQHRGRRSRSLRRAADHGRAAGERQRRDRLLPRRGRERRGRAAR